MRPAVDDSGRGFSRGSRASGRRRRRGLRPIRRRERTAADSGHRRTGAAAPPRARLSHLFLFFNVGKHRPLNTSFFFKGNMHFGLQRPEFIHFGLHNIEMVCRDELAPIQSAMTRVLRIGL